MSTTQPPLFVLRLPLELSPTLNAYAGLKGWRRAKLRKAVDWRILAIQRGGIAPDGARRRVVVTRHSSREPDELSCDVLGAKIALDRLVIAGILAGDSRKHLDREAHWVYAKPGAGELVVEVYEAVDNAGVKARTA